MYGFRISREGPASEAGAVRFAGLTVAQAAWLPLLRLEDARGEPFGVVIGWPVCGESWTLREGVWRFNEVPDDLAAFHREYLEPLRGSWIAMVAGGGGRRAYLDPFGTLSLVYDPAARTAGGTAADILTPDQYASRRDHGLHDRLGVSGDGWFPAGLTAHRGVERLLVNHYLDLDAFDPVRHRDYAGTPAGSGLVDHHLDTLAGEIRGLARALEKLGPVAMGVTGGADSRMMLAALKGATENVLLYTVAAPGSRFDQIRAGELASRFGLRHEVLPYVRATEEQSAEWDRRAGHAVATANRTMFPSVEPLRGFACLGGLGGEVGRCFLWPETGEMPARADARYVLDALKLPREPIVEQRIERWLAQLPVDEPTRGLDLAYIELRMGPWAFAQSYANPASLVLHPLGSAAALTAMLSLPADYRRNDGMVRALIARHWPELADLPINRYGDWRDVPRKLGKLANPPRAWRKLRQLARTWR